MKNTNTLSREEALELELKSFVRRVEWVRSILNGEGDEKRTRKELEQSLFQGLSQARLVLEEKAQ